MGAASAGKNPIFTSAGDARIVEASVSSVTRPSPQHLREAHGIAGWPHGEPEPTLPRPETLPDGASWPRVRIVVLSKTAAATSPDTRASLDRQDYPESDHALVQPSDLAPALDDRGADWILVLQDGDLLAPGALTALCLEAALSEAVAVAGLRVRFCDRVTGLDLPALSGVHPDEKADFGGGGVIFARSAIAGLGGGPAEWWAHLAASGARLARIGRPVLLERSAADAGHVSQRLAIAALTGTGAIGGAGIAHRRLAEALQLSGHRVEALTLSDESPPAAAEWTDAFPRTEAALRQGGFDWVLAGNLHGATRSLDILGRIAGAMPVAAVLHDLFPLTGRCAHPKGCRLIETGCTAACPTPDEYPQLAPKRIAAAHAAKRAVLAARKAPRLLANSAWTQAQALAFGPAGVQVSRVTLAVPAGVFRPMDKAALRRSLGLPPHDVLVMFSSVIVDAPDKGFADLLATLRRVARPGVGFVAIGRLDDPARLGLPNLFSPGAIGEEAVLAAWYGACDLHVTASRFETLGQTPLEAGLCGMPTLAYRVSGLTTSVIDGVSGVLVPPEPDALADALETLIVDKTARERLGAFGRIALESRFSHAAAAISLHEILCEEGIVSESERRPTFLPEMLGRFAFAAERAEGIGGTVEAPSPALVRRLRRLKQAVLGRNLPLWLRQAALMAARLRRAARRRTA